MSLQSFKLPEDDGGFDLTPMIDVVFLLIVFFMTVASMISADKVDLNLAVADESAIPKEIGDRSTFSIMADGTFYAGPRPVELDELREIISKLASHSKKLSIVLRADRMAEHQYVNQVLQICAESGISDIIFATYQSDL